MIEISKFKIEDLPALQSLIHFTIKTCYPAVYAPEIVHFFINYHSENEILKRSETGLIIVLKSNQRIVATGFLLDNEIGGVYVHPDHQKKGLGRKTVDYLLNAAREKGLKWVHLDSTPIAKGLYLMMGFTITEEAIQMVGEVPLPYTKMELHFNDEILYSRN